MLACTQIERACLIALRTILSTEREEGVSQDLLQYVRKVRLPCTVVRVEAWYVWKSCFMAATESGK